MQNKNLVHSPLLNLPLGEPCILPNGEPAVRLAKGQRTEEIPAVDYMELIFGKQIWSDLLHRGVGSPSETATPK